MLNPEPLIFIDSANKVNQNKNQTVYDSRHQQPLTKEEEMPKKVDVDILNKIEAIIELYLKNKMIICEVITIDNRYEGIPINKEGHNLVLKQNGSITLISMNTIVEVNILRI